MRISDWSSDVCSSDLIALARDGAAEGLWLRAERQSAGRGRQGRAWASPAGNLYVSTIVRLRPTDPPAATLALVAAVAVEETRSEEHTSELQSLMRISYAVFCLKKNNQQSHVQT